jgi:hypothetical protein
MGPPPPPPPDPSRGDVTLDNLAYFDRGFCIQHDSCPDVLTFGTPYEEYSVVLPAVGVGAGSYEVWYESNASYFLLINVSPGRVSWFIHWITTLSSSIWIIGAPDSHVHLKQWQCRIADVVDERTRQGELRCFSKEFSRDRHTASNAKVEKVC